MMENTKDISVLLIFFNRPEFFRRVFEQVIEAKPKRLFLYQDGPRPNNREDVDKILECRKIAENVTWDCEVRRLYQEKNFGCNPSGYIAQKWAFSQTDKCIVLEDDVVPSVSFFEFCRVLLDKYEFDERITLIAGMNHEESTKVDGDYFFTSFTSIWGWASWARVVSEWDPKYQFLDDPYYKQMVADLVKQRKYQKKFMQTCYGHRDTEKDFFESILMSSQYLNNGLNIVPRINIINNIGVTSDSTHFAGSIKILPKGFRKVFMIPLHEMSFPLRHPRHIIENVGYKDRVYRINAWGHPFVKGYRMVEELLYLLIYEGFSAVHKRIMRKLKRTY